MSDQYIDPEKVRSLFRQREELGRGYWAGWNDAVRHILFHCPATDATKITHAMWVHDEPYAWCSRCGERVLMSAMQSKYCPQCGAKMDLYTRERKTKDDGE